MLRASLLLCLCWMASGCELISGSPVISMDASISMDMDASMDMSPPGTIYTHVNITTLEGGAFEIDADQTLVLSVQARGLQGEDVSCVPAWSFADPLQGSISQGGVFSPRTTGDVEIRATCGDLTDTQTIRVNLPFAPASETQQLRLWLAADRGLSLQTDDTVMGWDDLSPEKLMFAPLGADGGRVQRVFVDDIGGMPAVVSQGTQRLDAGLSRQIDRDVTVFFVLRPDASMEEPHILLGDCVRHGDHQWSFSGARTKFYSEFWEDGVRQTSTRDDAMLGLGTTEWAARTLLVRPGHYDLYEDGMLVDSKMRSERADLKYAFQYLFGWCGGANRFQGALAELLLFQGVLDGEQRARIEGYLMRKYKL